MFGYKIQIDQVCIHSSNSDEMYGDWEAEYSNSFCSIRRTTEADNHPDLVSSLDVQDQSPVFIVWLEFSQGDSFGHGIRNQTEVLGVFRDRKAAEELATALRKTADRDTDVAYDDELSITTQDGQNISLTYMPWLGYFEQLEEVHVDQAFMGDNIEKNRWWPW